jgi:hypothetical protein
MAKTLIKIAVALLVLHGAVRLGMAYWDFYRYEDALQQLALFGERRPDKQLCEDALATAASYNRPPFNCETGVGALGPDRPTRAGEIGFLGGYVEQVTLFPGYTRPWEFKLQVAVRATP